MNCQNELPTVRAGDQEVFERVWKRVMPDGGEGCPIVVETTTVGGDLPCACACPMPRAQQEPQAQGVPSGLGAASSPHRGADFPDLTDVARLGPSSGAYGPLLQQQVTDALQAWQLYRCLARRSNGRSGRMLSAAASEKHHAARRLAAAYFLISGVRFWPVGRLSTPQIPSYLGTIRRGYQAEQQREQAYLMSAAETSDEALQELYQDLAAQSAAHGELMRTLLEQTQL